MNEIVAVSVLCSVPLIGFGASKHEEWEFSCASLPLCFVQEIGVLVYYLGYQGIWIVIRFSV